MPDWQIECLDEYLKRHPGRGHYQALQHARRSKQFVPDFMIGEFPPVLVAPEMGQTFLGPIGCYALFGFRLTTQGILTTGSSAMCTLATNHPANYVCAALPEVPNPVVRRLDMRLVMLSGPGYGVYGHWLIDILPRLYVLDRCGYKLSSLSFVLPSARPKFVDALLATFGIDGGQLVFYDEKSETLEAAELLVATNLRQGQRLHPYFRHAWEFLRRRTAVETATKTTRLFILRRGSDDNRKLLNREQIEAMAERNGCALVEPGSMTVQQQMTMFSSATQIVGEYGSGLHGAIFSPPGTTLLALRGSSWHPGFIQTEIADLMGHRLGYAIGYTPLTAVEQSFTIPEPVFVRGMELCISGGNLRPLKRGHRSRLSPARTNRCTSGLDALRSPTDAKLRLPIIRNQDTDRRTPLDTSLWQDFQTNQGRVIHKWRHYFPVYERHFTRYKNTSSLFIEIGCGAGGSLPMWKRFFGPSIQIVGIDINPECKMYEEDQVSVRIGDQSDPAFLDGILAEFGSPEIVLDDGSHRMDHINATFRHLFPKVQKDGVYVVEDLHTAYWPAFGGGLNEPASFIETCKSLIDELNGEWTVNKSKVTDFTNQTTSMHFYDSMVVLEKSRMLPRRSFASGNGKVWEA